MLIHCVRVCAYPRSLIDWCDVTVLVMHSFPSERMHPAAFLGETPTELSLPSFEANIQSSSTSEVGQATI